MSKQIDIERLDERNFVVVENGVEGPTKKDKNGNQVPNENAGKPYREVLAYCCSLEEACKETLRHKLVGPDSKKLCAEVKAAVKEIRTIVAEIDFERRFGEGSVSV